MDSTRGTHQRMAALKSLHYHPCIVTIAHRLFTIRSTPLPVMCGALDVSCMRFGVLDTSHLKATIILRYYATIVATEKKLIFKHGKLI